MYSTIFSTESPAAGAGEISKHRLMKQMGRLRDIACAWIKCASTVFSAYAVTVVM